MQTSLPVIVNILAVVTMSSLSEARTSAGSPCMLGGEEYMVGETWHPKLITFGENACVNCTCLPEGVKCLAVDCPKPKCEEPRIVNGECCPTCDDIDNLPPTVRKEDEGSDVIDTPGCEYEDMYYEDGDVFPSNKTALKATQDNQCVLCACFKSEVYCHLKTCPSISDCRRVIHLEDDCCPHCAEKPRSVSENQTLKEGDCLSATGKQANGSTWKPEISPFGKMECIVCNCLNGKVECSRLQCPDESSLKCSNPVLDKDKCCKVCEEKKKKPNKKRRKCRKKSTADGKPRKNCKKRKSRNKKNKNSKKNNNDKVIFKDSMTLDDVIHRLCLPKKAERLVYHTKGDDFETLAFDSPSDKTIEHIHWTIKKGRMEEPERKLILQPESEQFRHNVTVADILGGIRKRHIEKFMKRLDKRQRRCKKKCRRRLLERSIGKMKVKRLDLTKSCEA